MFGVVSSSGILACSCLGRRDDVAAYASLREIWQNRRSMSSRGNKKGEPETGSPFQCLRFLFVPWFFSALITKYHPKM